MHLSAKTWSIFQLKLHILEEKNLRKVLTYYSFLGDNLFKKAIRVTQTVTPILNVSRIFNMCAITDIGYINLTIQKPQHN